MTAGGDAFFLGKETVQHRERAVPHEKSSLPRQSHASGVLQRRAPLLLAHMKGRLEVGLFPVIDLSANAEPLLMIDRLHLMKDRSESGLLQLSCPIRFVVDGLTALR